MTPEQQQEFSRLKALRDADDPLLRAALIVVGNAPAVATYHALWSLLEQVVAENERLRTLRPAGDWHEDDGPVLWWLFVGENLIVGPVAAHGLEEYFDPKEYSHFSPIPKVKLP